MQPIEAAALSEIRDNTAAQRELGAVGRDMAKAMREFPAQCGQEIRATTPVIGQEVRDTGTHLGVIGFGGGGAIMVLIFVFKIILLILSAWLKK